MATTDRSAPSFPDLRDRTVLVTGGTRGLGKAIGQAFAASGARVWLTHRWGSVSESRLAAEFAAAGLPAATVVECDASDAAATRALLGRIGEETGGLDVAVSNVAYAKIVADLADYRRKSLELSIGFSAWPLAELARAAREVLGHCPRYLVGISSDGADFCHPGYEMAGMSKALMETLARYLALRLRPEGVRVNIVRPGYLDTDSLRATFGDAVIDDFAAAAPGIYLEPAAVAAACVALCSGLMDAVTGQVLTVDEGWGLVSPLSMATGHGLPAPFPDDGAPDVPSLPALPALAGNDP